MDEQKPQEPHREAIIFNDKDRIKLFPRRPRQQSDGEANHIKIVIRTFPPDAPDEFIDETVWVGPGFQEGVSEHDEDRDPFSCKCENCTRHHHHLKSREDVAKEKLNN